MILTIRTDKPEAELGLYELSGEKLAYESWQAHRELSTTLLRKVTELLEGSGRKLEDVEALVFYEGPGSFTGLRIGASFVNALQLPVVNASNDNWITAGLKDIKNAKISGARPMYGAEAHTTQQKK